MSSFELSTLHIIYPVTGWIFLLLRVRGRGMLQLGSIALKVIKPSRSLCCSSSLLSISPLFKEWIKKFIFRTISLMLLQLPFIYSLILKIWSVWEWQMSFNWHKAIQWWNLSCIIWLHSFRLDLHLFWFSIPNSLLLLFTKYI